MVICRKTNTLKENVDQFDFRCLQKITETMILDSNPDRETVYK